MKVITKKLLSSGLDMYVAVVVDGDKHVGAVAWSEAGAINLAKQKLQKVLRDIEDFKKN